MALEEGMYRTRDSLKNFFIKVELCKLTSGGAAVGILRETSQLTASRASTVGGGQDTETWIFRWQEKVFSQHEEECYADANNCTTPLEDKYHQDILTLRNEGGRPNCRLFSYVDNDQFHGQVDEVGQLPTDSNTPTFASRHFSSVRRRHIGRRTDRAPPVRRQPPVSERPSEEERISHRIITPPSQVMYIMADLRRMDGHDLTDEHILCRITVDSHGVVSVKPDFNQDRPAHRVESRHREVFEYRLEHASEPIAHEERAKERRILSEAFLGMVLCFPRGFLNSENLPALRSARREIPGGDTKLYSRHANYLHSCVGSTFADPPESSALRVILLGEIATAQGFEYDHLYVTAHLELPEFWELEEDQSLSVTTQICRTKSRHKYNVAHFSCPFEYTLLYHNPTLTEDTFPTWPRILLEVSSLDFWDRHRTEGYGYTNLPSRPGEHDLTVHTWRPSGIRVLDKMKRFFIGGAPEIDDVSFVAQPRDFEGTHLSKYGFRTESSGTVTLCFNILHQSSLIAERSQSATLTHLAKHKGFNASVAATLDVYQRAKQRAASLTTTLQ